MDERTKTVDKNKISCLIIFVNRIHLPRNPEVGGSLLKFEIKDKLTMLKKLDILIVSALSQISSIMKITASQYKIVKRKKMVSLKVVPDISHLLLNTDDSERISVVFLELTISIGATVAQRITNRFASDWNVKQMISMGRSFCQVMMRRHFMLSIVFKISTNHR
jgi:hypothetical protein